jgi:hypothetical protein
MQPIPGTRGHMKTRSRLPRGVRRLAASLLLAFGLFMPAGAAQKLKLAELAEKHLASIGTPEARAAIRNRVVKGAATVLIKPAPEIQHTIIPEKRENPSGIQGYTENLYNGNAVFVSEGKQVRLGLRFATSGYKGEDLAYDGKELQSQVAGRLSIPGELIQEGLLGGSLTTAWALLDHTARQPRLAYKGLKKLGGREYHQLQYRYKKDYGNGHEVEIHALMYFDPQTFRHLRTECRIVEMVPIIFGTETAIRTLTEEFADFTVADGLTLPRSYLLRYSRVSNRHRNTTEWNLAFDEIRHNQPLDPKTFIQR